MLIALSLVSVGNGFFKPNISTIVGALYEQGDRRREAGFTIFYMGINLGSIGGQLLLPDSSPTGSAGGPVSASPASACSSATLLIQFDGGRLDGYGERPESAENRDIVDLHLCAARGAGVRVPVQQSDELRPKPRPARASSATSPRCR